MNGQDVTLWECSGKNVVYLSDLLGVKDRILWVKDVNNGLCPVELFKFTSGALYEVITIEVS